MSSLRTWRRRAHIRRRLAEFFQTRGRNWDRSNWRRLRSSWSLETAAMLRGEPATSIEITSHDGIRYLRTSRRCTPNADLRPAARHLAWRRGSAPWLQPF